MIEKLWNITQQVYVRYFGGEVMPYRVVDTTSPYTDVYALAERLASQSSKEN